MKRRKRKRRIIFIIFILIIFLTLSFLIYKKFNVNNMDNNLNNDESNTYEEKKDDEKREVKLTLVGDFLFESPYYKAIEKGESLDKYFNKVKKYFEEDDLSIGNMEVVIGNDNLKVSGDGYNFCAPEYIGSLVSSLDLEVLSTANNHAYDRGLPGIKSSYDYFKNNSDILTVGTYDDSPKILDIKGIKFGFVSYTYGTNIKPSEEDAKYISTYKDANTKEIKTEKIKEDIAKIKDADVLVAIMHWGREFTYEENEEQRELASLLNSLGVHLIVGSHSHSIEPIKWYENGDNKTLVYYSLGNFTSADDDISRTGEEFDNAYQFGLLSTLTVEKENGKINIKDIKTEPIINYYDTSLENFELIPYHLYDKNYEESHYRYQYNFTSDFVRKTYEKVIDAEFR